MPRVRNSIPAPPGISPWVADYAPPNEAGVQGRARRQSHREGMGTPRGGGAMLNPNPPLPVAHQSTVHPSLFTPLIPSDDQSEKLQTLAIAARVFADVLDVTLPLDAFRGEVFIRLRELMFWAREHTLRNEWGEPRPRDDIDAPFGADPTVAPEPTPGWSIR